MDLARRPKLWMFRTRRFWFGLMALMMLMGMAMGPPGTYARGVGYGHWSRDGGAALAPGDYQALEIYWRRGSLEPTVRSEHGPLLACGHRGLIISEVTNSSPLNPPLSFGFHHSKLAIGFGTYSEATFVFPTWLLPLGWLVIWPLWGRRIGRKRKAKYSMDVVA